MVCVDKVPIEILHTNAIPSRVTDINRPTLKMAEVLTYDIMVEESISLVEMQNMGCNLFQVFYDWGDRPGAGNLNFRHMNRKCLNIVKCLLQNKVMRRHFNEVQWFTVGLSIKDMMDLQPSVDTLKLFNVTSQDLQANDAHNFGENWQNMFGWSVSEWKELGYDHKEYTASIQLQANAKGGPAQDTLRIHRQWGPPATGMLKERGCFFSGV